MFNWFKIWKINDMKWNVCKKKWLSNIGLMIHCVDFRLLWNGCFMTTGHIPALILIINASPVWSYLTILIPIKGIIQVNRISEYFLTENYIRLSLVFIWKKGKIEGEIRSINYGFSGYRLKEKITQLH